jgi:hypothetical protein
MDELRMLRGLAFKPIVINELLKIGNRRKCSGELTRYIENLLIKYSKSYKEFLESTGYLVLSQDTILTLTRASIKLLPNTMLESARELNFYFTPAQLEELWHAFTRNKAVDIVRMTTLILNADSYDYLYTKIYDSVQQLDVGSLVGVLRQLIDKPQFIKQNIPIGRNVVDAIMADWGGRHYYRHASLMLLRKLNISAALLEDIWDRSINPDIRGELAANPNFPEHLFKKITVKFKQTKVIQGMLANPNCPMSIVILYINHSDAVIRKCAEQKMENYEKEKGLYPNS